MPNDGGCPQVLLLIKNTLSFRAGVFSTQLSGAAQQTIPQPLEHESMIRPFVHQNDEGRTGQTANDTLAAEMRKALFPGLSEEVADGTRTRDHRDHNPGLYQLSYRHRAETQDTAG